MLAKLALTELQAPPASASGAAGTTGVNPHTWVRMPGVLKAVRTGAQRRLKKALSWQEAGKEINWQIAVWKAANVLASSFLPPAGNSVNIREIIM